MSTGSSLPPPSVPTPAVVPSPTKRGGAWLRYGAVLLVGILVGVAIGSSVKDKGVGSAADPSTNSPTTATVPSTTEPQPTTTNAPTTSKAPTTTSAPHTWVPSDFAVKLTVTESSCFDTAGANVTYEPSLTLLSAEAWNQTATIIYEVHGGESVDTKSIDIDPDGNYSVSRELIQTPTCSDVLTAVVTQVLVR